MIPEEVATMANGEIYGQGAPGYDQEQQRYPDSSGITEEPVGTAPPLTEPDIYRKKNHTTKLRQWFWENLWRLPTEQEDADLTTFLDGSDKLRRALPQEVFDDNMAKGFGRKDEVEFVGNYHSNGSAKRDGYKGEEVRTQKSSVPIEGWGESGTYAWQNNSNKGGPADFFKVISDWQNTHQASDPDIPGLVAQLTSQGITGVTHPAHAANSTGLAGDKIRWNGKDYDIIRSWAPGGQGDWQDPIWDDGTTSGDDTKDNVDITKQLSLRDLVPAPSAPGAITTPQGPINAPESYSPGSAFKAPDYASPDPYVAGTYDQAPDFNRPEFTPAVPFQRPEFSAAVPFTVPTAEDMGQDPGYQFRVSEGQKDLERSGAARGVSRTGGEWKAITDYGQNAASQEYGNVYGRSKDSYDTNERNRRDAYEMNYGNSLNAYNTNEANRAGAYGTNYGNAYNAYRTNEANRAGTYESNEAQRLGAYGMNRDEAFKQYSTNAYANNAYNDENARRSAYANTSNNQAWGQQQDFAASQAQSQFLNDFMTQQANEKAERARERDDLMRAIIAAGIDPKVAV